MIVKDLYKDNYLKFDHSEVINSSADDLSAVGASTSIEIRSMSFSPDDTNSIFVKSDGNDSTGDGTQLNPYKTIKYASTQVTASKQYVVIDDSAEYEESQLNMTGNFVGLVSSIGNAPTIIPATIPDQFDLNAVDDDFELNTQDVFPTDEYTYQGFQVKLSNGNYAVYYSKRLTSDNDNSKDFEVRCKIFNSTFTTTISDTKLFDITAQNLGFNLSGSSSNLSQPVVLEDKFVFVLYKTVYLSSSSDYRIVVNNDGSLHSQTQYGSGGMVYNYLHTVKNNLYSIIVIDQNTSQTTFYLYNSNTIVYSNSVVSTKKVNHLYVDDDYLYYCIATGAGDCDFYKIDLSTYSSTYITKTGDSNKWWYSGGGTNKVKIFKCNNKYFIIFDTSAGYSIQEYDLATYLPINSAKSLTSIISGKTYNYTSLSNTIYVHQIKYLNDNQLLIAFYLSGSGMIFNVFDMSLFNSANATDYTCYQSQTCVPDYNSVTFNTHLFQLDNFQFIIVTAGKQLRIFDMAIIKANVDTVINGIIFDADDNPYIRNIIKATDDLDVRFCTFKDVYNSTSDDIDKFDSNVVKATGATIIKNTYSANSTSGFDITNDSVNFENNAVIRCTEGNAVQITGSGTGIIFNHNTVYDNLEGLELIGNDGTEIIKNSILYSNSSYGVKVETAVVVYNSCCPDTLVNVTLDSDTSNALNPLFVNEGVENPEQTDIHIKTRTAGYSVNSPALEIGDDGLDAGCYNVEYTVLPASYTTFVIPKPKKIELILSPVNPVEITTQDGTYDISVDAWQIEVNLIYDSITVRYINYILKLYTATGDVRIYFNPASDPYLFETMKLKYKDLSLANDFYKHNEDGIKDIKLTFIRKFDVEELD